MELSGMICIVRLSDWIASATLRSRQAYFIPRKDILKPASTGWDFLR